MKIYRIFLVICLVVCLVDLSYSQDKTNAVGAGVSIGGAVAKTDISHAKTQPFGRAFLRYHPTTNLAVEAGIGLGVLEADGSSFFSTQIIPFDVRFMVQPIQVRNIVPYFYAGVGILSFNPVDQNNDPLPNNKSSVYSLRTSYFPLGAGVEYFFTDNSAVEFSGSYNYVQSQYLSGSKSKSKDGYYAITLNFFSFFKMGNVDSDGDGLTDDEEHQLGTDSFKADTDGDGLTDSEEAHIYNTNPLKKDTDGDGLFDGDEVLTNHTDPLKADTDGDGLSDGAEILTFRTDPLKVDTDGDGLSDGEESLTYHSDPLKVDSDDDGVNDADEILKYRTDPTKKDTDGDGLSDSEEILKYHTNPLNIDTDGGSASDGEEVRRSTNPLDPNDDRVQVFKVGQSINLDGINFVKDQTVLLPEAKIILDKFASILLQNPSIDVAIYGHTENLPSAKKSLTLSQDRADAVRTYLINKGIPGQRLTAKGFGYTKPVADNSTPEGQTKNRRIEFKRMK